MKYTVEELIKRLQLGIDNGEWLKSSRVEMYDDLENIQEHVNFYYSPNMNELTIMGNEE